MYPFLRTFRLILGHPGHRFLKYPRFVTLLYAKHHDRCEPGRMGPDPARSAHGSDRVLLRKRDRPRADPAARSDDRPGGSKRSRPRDGPGSRGPEVVPVPDAGLLRSESQVLARRTVPQGEQVGDPGRGRSLPNEGDSMMAAENVLLCDACTFMPAVRECARCGRELCFDC